MSKLKPAAPIKPVTAIEWSGVRTQRVDYEAGATIFAQGDPATSVMYVEAAPSGCQSCPTQERRR